MSPLDHYRTAEELLALAAHRDDVRASELGVIGLSPLELLAAAAVHAQLAGVGAPVSGSEPGPTGRYTPPSLRKRTGRATELGAPL